MKSVHWFGILLLSPGKESIFLKISSFRWRTIPSELDFLPPQTGKLLQLNPPTKHPHPALSSKFGSGVLCLSSHP